MLKRDSFYLLRQRASSYFGDIVSNVITHDGIQYRYLESGNNHGECIVFLHGLLGSKSQWRGLMAELSQTHRVISLDIPGLSSSDRNSAFCYDFSSLALHLNHFLASLEIKNAALVGHCVGGNLAQLYQSLYPDIVKRLVLISPVGMELQDKTVLVSKVSQFRHMLDFNSFDEFNYLVNNLFFQPVTIAKLLLELRMKELIRNKVSIIKVVKELEMSLNTTVAAVMTSESRRLVICGDADVFADKDDFKFFDFCKNVEFKLIEQCGHVPFLEHPKKTDQLVRDFLINTRTN